MNFISELKFKNRIISNFKTVKTWYLIPPLILLIVFTFHFFVITERSDYVNQYISVQKDLLFYLNNSLSTYSSFQYNITQLGDALILFPLLSIFIVYAPKILEIILTSGVFSLLASVILKKLSAGPRPADIFENGEIVIIGKAIIHHGNSTPSGHSVTIFMVTSILMFALMPKKNTPKILWFLFMILIGIGISISRIAIGAHYPIDVASGCLIGFITAILGIKISNKFNWRNWIKSRYNMIFIVLIIIAWLVLLIQKIMLKNLPIFYISLFSLTITLFVISKKYVQRN